MLLDDPQRGLRLLDAAIARFPLESLNPLDRPYGHLAMAYAAAGEVERARTLLTAYEQMADADHSTDAERWADGARGVIALTDGRAQDAITAFREFDTANECGTCATPWLARAFDMAGQTDSVVASFTRFVDRPSSSLWYDAAHAAHAYERLGEIWEQRGDPQKAAQYYARLLSIMKEPDPELRSRVDDARSALERLTGERRSTGT
jgi:tetratricopeptide (TPR) repeat protein